MLRKRSGGGRFTVLTPEREQLEEGEMLMPLLSVLNFNLLKKNGKIPGK